MIQHGRSIRSRSSGPWLALFMTLVLAIIAFIIGLSAIPGRTLDPIQVSLDPPQILAPAAPSAMR